MHARRQSLELVVEGGVVPPGGDTFSAADYWTLAGETPPGKARGSRRLASSGGRGCWLPTPTPCRKWHQICLPALSAAHESGHGAPFVSWEDDEINPDQGKSARWSVWARRHTRPKATSL